MSAIAATTRRPIPIPCDAFARDGHCAVRGLLTASEAAQGRAAALAYADRPIRPHHDSGIFRQMLNVWREDPLLKAITFHPAVTGAVRAILGGPARLWHDQLLIKRAASEATVLHQDQPYWPLGRKVNSVSVWIALGDTPEEHGCMSFVSATQCLRQLPPQDITDPGSLIGQHPEVAWMPRITVPLRAGDATFHDGFCVHSASPNRMDRPRVAHVAIFVYADACYLGGSHPVTDPLALRPGDALPDHAFPLV